jgi:formamidase
MTGLGGLNKSARGVVLGLVQLQLPNVKTKADLAAQTARVCELVAKARRNLPTMDLVVFPEYSLHGLSMDTNPEIMCSLDGPEVAAIKQACVENRIWGCFSIMEFNPRGNPYNSGLIIDDTGAIRLYYRKLHPWVPVEPWEPGNLGVPVCDGPNGSRIGLIICHDGMFPEMAREAAYKGAEIILRTAGYTAPIRHTWQAFACAVPTAPSIRWARACSAVSTARCWWRAAAGPTKSSPPSFVPTCAARRAPDGAWRTTSTSSIIAAMSP